MKIKKGEMFELGENPYDIHGKILVVDTMPIEKVPHQVEKDAWDVVTIKEVWIAFLNYDICEDLTKCLPNLSILPYSAFIELLKYEKVEEILILLNGKTVKTQSGITTYEKLVESVGGNPNNVYSVVFSNSETNISGTLVKGGSLILKRGTRISIMRTNNA